MEYTFRKATHQGEIALVLGDYSFIRRMGGKEEVISYASITDVRISKLSNHVFKIYLSADGHQPIVISSQSFEGNGMKIDQSAGYAMFVRVLHHYLKDKSQAAFTSGGNTARIWQLAVVSALFSFWISIAADYLVSSLMNPYIQALIFAALTATIIIVSNFKKLPKSYHPGDIPIQFLP